MLAFRKPAIRVEYDYTYGISDNKFKEIQEQMERNKLKSFAIPNLSFAKIQFEPVSVNSKSVHVISQPHS